jgi:taurine dioxygenase
MPLITVSPSARYPFGCRIDGLDIGQGVDSESFAIVEAALHKHLVVCISGKPYGPEQLVAFGKWLGPLEISVARSFHHGSVPEVTVLSNRIIEGRPEGSADAGQMWHTDMSYNRVAGRASVLHSHQIPMREGRALGDTAFRDMHAAYEALPEAMRARLDTLEAVHEFEKIWDTMRARGSPRPPYTDAQRRQKPPVVHPVVLRHPWTGRKALYVNRGLTRYILGLPRSESDDLLEYLYQHAEDERFEYRHVWRVGDTLIWDNCATIHLATGGYGPETPRVMIRTQVLGDEARYAAANGSMGLRIADVQFQQ